MSCEIPTLPPPMETGQIGKSDQPRITAEEHRILNCPEQNFLKTSPSIGHWQKWTQKEDKRNNYVIGRF